MLEFEVKAVVDDPESLKQDSTVYLFNKEQRILLPIKMPPPSAVTILNARETPNEIRPHIHNTAIRIIKALKAEVDSITIYAYQEEIFYSYIKIRRGGNCLEIDARPSDAISIALRQDVPVFVNESVYERVGIKVTKELLRNSI